MTKSFTVYWTPEGYEGFKPGDPIHRAYGTFAGRISAGDRVYVTNVKGGAARLLGAFTVAKVRPRGAGISPPDQLYAEPDSGVAFAQRPIPIPVAQALRFKGKGEAGLVIRADGSIDGQTLRSVRELQPESAKALEALLAASDAAPEETGGGSIQDRRETTPIYDDEGQLVQARFSVLAAAAGTFDVILGSRGGQVRVQCREPGLHARAAVTPWSPR